MNEFQYARMQKIRSGISDLSFPLKKWRYLIVFQSGSQVASWVVMILSCLVMISYFLVLDNNPKIPHDTVLLSAVFGSSFSLFSVLHVKFTAQDNGLGVLSEIECHLLKMNYVEDERYRGGVVYRQNLPRLLRWNEGNVRISTQDSILTVSGAYITVRHLRRRLMKSCV